MINDTWSYIVDIIDILFQIMQPLWLFLVAAALVNTLLERLQFIRFLPNNALTGALLGIISPLPTIGIVSLVKDRNQGTAAFLIGSLLANPALLIMILINLGFDAMLLYGGIVFLTAAIWSQMTQFNPEPTTLPSKAPQTVHWAVQTWKYFAYIGFYTVVGALLSAVLREGFSWTIYNLQVLSYLPAHLKAIFVVFAGPLYQCGGMWLPILKELHGMGLGLGVAIGFVLFGQVTRVGHLLALQTVFSRQTLIYLVLSLCVVSVSLGVLF